MKAKRSETRRAFVVALLLAFLLQGQLAASHFHFAAAGSGIALADAGKSTLPRDQKKAPSEDNCPICQQLASAHNLLLHPAAALSLPDLVGAQPFELFDERAPVALIAFNWRSRAPPL